MFSITGVERWLEHYRGPGSEDEAHDEEYGFAPLDTVELHVSRNQDHDPRTTAGCAYLGVTDADVVWRRRPTAPVARTSNRSAYGTREGAHIDPDDNLIRYGSRH